MMDCISQAQRDRVAAESALEHLHSIIIIYLVQGTKGYVCWSLQYAAGSGIFPFFKKNVIQQLATHKKKTPPCKALHGAGSTPSCKKTDWSHVGRGGEGEMSFLLLLLFLNI